MAASIQGICPIISTPFHASGEVDYDGLRGTILWLAEGGCHAVTLFGIAGEYYKLDDQERRQMVETTVGACRDAGCPSIISVTDHATEVAVRRAKEWEAAGADCLMLLPPFFLKPSAADLYRHMVSVAEAVSIPVMLQYAPEQTGVTMTPETLTSIQDEVDAPIIFKIENRPPGKTISRILEITAGEAKVFIGNAGFQLIEGLDRGAVGAMPGCSMFDVYLQIYNDYHARDRAGALAKHTTLLAVLNHIRQNVEQIIAFEKRILKRRGVVSNDSSRSPGFDSDEVYDRLFDEVYHMISPLFTGSETPRA